MLGSDHFRRTLVQIAYNVAEDIILCTCNDSTMTASTCNCFYAFPRNRNSTSSHSFLCQIQARYLLWGWHNPHAGAQSKLTVTSITPSPNVAYICFHTIKNQKILEPMTEMWSSTTAWWRSKFQTGCSVIQIWETCVVYTTQRKRCWSLAYYITSELILIPKLFEEIYAHIPIKPVNIH